MPAALRQPETFTPTLADCYIGPLAGFIAPQVGGKAPLNALNVSRWREQAWLENDLATFAAQYPDGDRRAIVSIWSRWHFSCLTIATLAGNLLLNRDLPVGLDEAQIIFNEEGASQQLWLAHEGTPLATHDPRQRFATLVEGHWAPLIERLAAISGAAPRVFWSNAGGYFDYYANALAEHPMAHAEAVAAARALLDTKTFDDGTRNPLFQPIRRLPSKEGGEEKRVRKICCLRYLLPQFGVCGNCPLEGCDRSARRR